MGPNDTFSKLKQQERETRRNLILDAAERVFAQTPFTDVNMRSIAKEAGISPASIYTYFSDQETLFVEAYLRRSQDVLKILDNLIQSDDKDLLESVSDAYIEYFTKHDVYFRMMAHFMLYAKLNPFSLDKLNTMERALLDMFDKVFRKSGFTGKVRFHSHTFFAALNGILISFRKYPGRSEKDVLAHMKRLAVIVTRSLRQG